MDQNLEVFSQYYYPKAKWLQENCNWGAKNYTGVEADMFVGDNLMQNIEIYDCYTRNAAGFSNVLQDLWHQKDTPKWHHQDSERHHIIMGYGSTSSWQTADWLYAFLVHRVTGSGASFQDDHGYRNNLVQIFGMLPDRKAMADQLRMAKADGAKLFTSIGNQPPAPKGMDNITWLTTEGITLVERMTEWLYMGHAKTHKEVVDYANKWNIEHGHRRFNFQYAALSMDISDYMPTLVDPDSHTYLGNNAKRCKKLLFGNLSDDKAMDVLVELTGGRAKDLEDVMCDFVRFGQNYDPWGRGRFYNDVYNWNPGWGDRSV